MVMFIGRLSASPSFYHRGTAIPFSPDTVENGVFTWNWDTVYDNGVDVALELSKPSFVGAVRLSLVDESEVPSVQILADGKPAGVLDARDSAPLTGTLTIPVGVTAKKLIIRIGADLKMIAFREPEILGAEEDDAPFVYPAAEKLTAREGAPVRIASISSDSTEDACFAADYLRSRLCERFAGWESGSGVPVSLSIDVSMTGERYTVDVSSDGIKLTAGARLPLLYAVESLLCCGEDGSFALCSISDAPYKPMRGFHFGLPPRDHMGFMRRLIRYVLIPMRYNQLFVEFAGGMRFKRHPEISEGWLEGNRAAREGRQPAFPQAARIPSRRLGRRWAAAGTGRGS